MDPWLAISLSFKTKLIIVWVKINNTYFIYAYAYTQNISLVWNLRSFLIRIWNWPSYMEGKEKLTKKASQSRLVGGRFNKQKELTNGLVFGGCEIYRSLYLPARIFQIYIDTLTVFIHVYCLDGLNNTVLSQGCNLNNSSHCKNNG